MALQNGVLVHGPTAWGCAVRDESGTLHVAAGKKPLPRADRTPADPDPPRAARPRRCVRAPAGGAPRAAAGPVPVRAPQRPRWRFVGTAVVAKRLRRSRLSPGRDASSPQPASRSFLRRWRFAGPTSPRTTARSTSPSARTRTTAFPRRRSTRAVGRSSSRRWSLRHGCERRRREGAGGDAKPRSPLRDRSGDRRLGRGVLVGGAKPDEPRRARPRASRIRASEAPLDRGAVGRPARGRERGSRRLPRART